MKTKQPQPVLWYGKRSSALLLCVVALGATYGVVSLAINSGSLGQYCLTVILLSFALNRLAHAVLPRKAHN